VQKCKELLILLGLQYWRVLWPALHYAHYVASKFAVCQYAFTT